MVCRGDSCVVTALSWDYTSIHLGYYQRFCTENDESFKLFDVFIFPSSCSRIFKLTLTGVSKSYLFLIRVLLDFFLSETSLDFKYNSVYQELIVV